MDGIRIKETSARGKVYTQSESDFFGRNNVLYIQKAKNMMVKACVLSKITAHPSRC